MRTSIYINELSTIYVKSVLHFLLTCKIKKETVHTTYELFDQMVYEMLVSESQPVTLMLENTSSGETTEGET